MRIINNENFISNNELKQIINLLNEEYKPNKLVIYENKKDIIKFAFKYGLIKNLKPSYLKGNIEAASNSTSKELFLYVFAQDGEEVEDKQFDTIYSLVYQMKYLNLSIKVMNELKVNIKSLNKLIEFSQKNQYSISEEGREAQEKSVEYATKLFMNENSDVIADIMDWEYELEVGDDY